MAVSGLELTDSSSSLVVEGIDGIKLAVKDQEVHRTSPVFIGSASEVLASRPCIAGKGSAILDGDGVDLQNR